MRSMMAFCTLFSIEEYTCSVYQRIFLPCVSEDAGASPSVFFSVSVITAYSLLEPDASAARPAVSERNWILGSGPRAYAPGIGAVHNGKNARSHCRHASIWKFCKRA